MIDIHKNYADEVLILDRSYCFSLFQVKMARSLRYWILSSGYAILEDIHHRAIGLSDDPTSVAWFFLPKGFKHDRD